MLNLERLEDRCMPSANPLYLDLAQVALMGPLAINGQQAAQASPQTQAHCASGAPATAPAGLQFFATPPPWMVGTDQAVMSSLRPAGMSAGAFNAFPDSCLRIAVQDLSTGAVLFDQTFAPGIAGVAIFRDFLPTQGGIYGIEVGTSWMRVETAPQ